MLTLQHLHLLEVEVRQRRDELLAEAAQLRLLDTAQPRAGMLPPVVAIVRRLNARLFPSAADSTACCAPAV